MEKNLIQVLINAESKKIAKLYNGNRDAFLNFGKKYGLDYDDLTDIYQEAFIAIRQHALNGKLDTVKCSFNTYLFGICKFKIFDLLKEKKKNTSLDSFLYPVKDDIEIIDFEADTITERQQLLYRYFKQLGKKCQELLTLFYSKGLSIDEIVLTTKYNSDSVVRSQKSRCIKTLRELINSKKNVE